MNVGTVGHIDHGSHYKNYKSHVSDRIIKMRPWIDGEDVSHLDIASFIVPEQGGMIAYRNGKEYGYITPKFLQEFYYETND